MAEFTDAHAHIPDIWIPAHVANTCVHVSHAVSRFSCVNHVCFMHFGV